MKKRSYKMRRRAEDQERTRRKIVEATVALHGTVGPKNTTISAVAEKAGVQRLTVYRHFPSEESLFLACSSHWLNDHPPPDPVDWSDQESAGKRTQAALAALFDYYRRTASMWRLVYRDIGEVPAMHRPVNEFHEYLGSIHDDLVKHWQPRGRKSTFLKATVGHALSFSTWASLDEQGLDDARMVELVIRWISSAAGSSTPD